MSLSLTQNFTEQQNLVVLLAHNAAKNGIAVRVASTGSGTLGTLTATGAASTSITWALNQAPTWVTLTSSASTLIATLRFSNAQAQPNPYLFYLTATDGATTVYFPILLEVREPFSIQSTQGTSFNIPSYDSTVPDIVFNGIGLSGAIDTGVQFVPPINLPGGLKFITADGSYMKLRVPEPTITNLSGGISLFTSGPVSTGVTLQAYKPGTMYDNPNRCFTQQFTVESLKAKQGTLDLGLTVYYNTTLNAFSLNSFVDFLGGQPQAVLYEWDVTGTANGNVSSGGTSRDTSMTWIPSGPGTVTFTLKVKNAGSGAVLGQTSSSAIACTTAGTWQSSSAIKLSFSAIEARGYAGDSPAITISTLASELAANETITVKFAVMTGGAGEALASVPATLTLTQAQPSAILPLTIPASRLNQKWVISATAANATSNPTRTGAAQVVFLSNGGQPLAVACAGGTALTSNVGQPIGPFLLTALNQLQPVTGVTYSLSGAPDGLYINSSGQLTGNALQPGQYAFSIVAEASGYARSYSDPITLTASAYSTPLSITDPVPSSSALPDNQQFSVSWGYAGTPFTLDMIQGFTVRSVFGSTQAQTSQVGTSVISIYGTSFFGDAHSIPTIVVSSSIVAQANLLDATTVGTLDEKFNLLLNWHPLTVNGSYQAYKAWNIWLKQLPNGSNQLQSIKGQLPTGLEVNGATIDSRIYAAALSTGDWQVSMQALSSDSRIAENSSGWDAPHQFPTGLASTDITFDNNTISLGQTLTISLNPSYGGADSWQAVYPDGTTSGWMPITVKTLAKTFSTPGNQPIIIQTQRDYSTANPPVKLNRQVTKSVYVNDQQYNSGAGSEELTGTLGFGGERGFEITSGSYNLTPYEVIVRALVRDTLSNELKLLVATARSSDASSLLGTMALDIFPIQGRPRVKDLIDPDLYLSPEMVLSGNPVVIGTKTLPNAIVGKPLQDFPLQVAQNSGVEPFSWYANNLPFGLNLSTDGTLTGTALELGTFLVDLVVMDSNVPPFIASAVLPLTVESDLAISTTSLPTAYVSIPFKSVIASTGGIPPYTWSIVAGEPPQGLTLDLTTGTLAGTPVSYNSTTDFTKTYSMTVQVVDAIGAIASTVLTQRLHSAPLSFGPIDQPEIFAGEQFELTIPIYGGTPPYTFVSFVEPTTDQVIGSGLRIANPDSIAAVAGVAPNILQITNANEAFFPQSYPFNPAFELTATGGVGPYVFSLAASKTTLPGATVAGSLLSSVVSTDGTYTVGLNCIDSLGHTATTTITVTTQQKNAGVYSIKPVAVNVNGSTNPANWTVTPISSLPDAQAAHPYNGGSNIYYGLALYQNNTLHLTQNSGQSPMAFSIRSGTLPDGIIAFSGNSYGQTTDFSGIQLFNVSGGQNAETIGQYSFEAEFDNIVALNGAVTRAVCRSCITVTANGGGSTPVVVVTGQMPSDYTVNLTNAAGWYYPLAAEGGTGTYTFVLQTGTTLPGAVIQTVNGLPVLTTSTQTPGRFVANVVAIDSNKVASSVTPIYIALTTTLVQPTYIVDANLPVYVYANRPLPVNTYYVESNLIANWSVSGLPAGLSLGPTLGTRTYLSGIPTATGNFTIKVTTTSVVYNTSATASYTVAVRAQTATFQNPPTTAVINKQYRVATNNAIVRVAYVGYQPGDTNLPLPTATTGTLGAPGTFNSNLPTTAVSNLTADGFTLSFDYSSPTLGNDTLHLGTATVTVAITYPPLVVTGTTVAVTVSEYSSSATFACPVSVSGGLAPYTLTPTGFSDDRFSAQGAQIVVPVSKLTPGRTVACSVAVQVVDQSGAKTTATGTLQITVRQETYATVNFSNLTWAVNVSSGTPFTSTLIPSKNGSVPALGHLPYQYYVDSLVIPSTLNGFVQASPSKRVLAIQFNSNSTSTLLPDVDQTLANSGTFLAAAVGLSAAPAAGSYQILAALRVVDNEGITVSQQVAIALTIS